MRTIEVSVYKFDELSDSAKEKARKWYRNGNLNYEWWDCVYEDHREKILEQGFEVTNMYFSGFWSQGDGAMFEYGGIDDKLLHEFVDTLNLSPMRKQWLKSQGYISGSGRQSGHYSHEKSCAHKIHLESNFDWRHAENFSSWIESYQDDFEDWLKEKYEDLCCSLYSALEKEYDYLQSDKVVDESIIANDYEFDEQGNLI